MKKILLHLAKALSSGHFHRFLHSDWVNPHSPHLVWDLLLSLCWLFFLSSVRHLKLVDQIHQNFRCSIVVSLHFGSLQNAYLKMWLFRLQWDWNSYIKRSLSPLARWLYPFHCTLQASCWLHHWTQPSSFLSTYEICTSSPTLAQFASQAVAFLRHSFLPV